jgi:hypothetical protein
MKLTPLEWSVWVIVICATLVFLYFANTVEIPHVQ